MKRLNRFKRHSSFRINSCVRSSDNDDLTPEFIKKMRFYRAPQYDKYLKKRSMQIAKYSEKYRKGEISEDEFYKKRDELRLKYEKMYDKAMEKFDRKENKLDPSNYDKA